MRKEINSEKIELNIDNETWEVKLVAYEGDEGTYRMLSDKNEIVILDNNDYLIFNAKYTDKYINIDHKDPGLAVSIRKGQILIYNRA